MTSKLRYLAGVPVTLLWPSVYLPVTSLAAMAPSGQQSEQRLQDGEMALARATAVIGLKEPCLTREPAIEELTDDRTPFLAQALAGRRAWKVTIEGPFEELSPKIIRLHCLLDQESGQLIRVVSEWPVSEPPLSPPPRSEAAADQMQKSGEELYHGFPATLPRVALFEALRTLERAGRGVSNARQIDCQYVEWSRIGKWRQPRRVWAITLRGIPPVHPPPGAPTDPTFSFRYIVDADTGEFLCGSNTPRPEK